MLRRILKYFVLVITAVLLAGLVYLLAPALWHRWVTYPRLEKEVVALEALRIAPPHSAPLNTYRGVIHAHSYWSHDSEGTLSRILPAARSAGLDFIFLSDHPHGNLDSFPRGYHGYYDGVLIEPGSEKHGYCMWPLDSGVVDWSVDRDTLVRDVVSRGGMFFYAHSEEPHNWSNPWYQAMEIYNIHTDTKDETLLPHVVNFLVNGNKYRHWALREVFDEQIAILHLWDSLNRVRKIVGFSAVDAHENQNIRARMLDDGRVEWLGPNADPFDTVSVNAWNRWMFHPPDEEGWVFELPIDTYETSFRYVTNYVFADTLTVASLSDHILRGHLYVAFQQLGDATGFMYWAEDNAGGMRGIVGDSVRVEDVARIRAVSPLPGTFKLVQNGRVVHESPAGAYATVSQGQLERGVYRMEVHLALDGALVPWLYSNPIYIY